MFYRFSDWKNINRRSNEFWDLDEQYFESFNERIPIYEFPKDVTMKELVEEVTKAIESGVCVRTKRKTDPNAQPKEDPNLIY